MLCKMTADNHPAFIINIGDPDELQVFIGHHEEPFQEFVARAISKVPCASKFLSFMDQVKDSREFDVLLERATDEGEPEPSSATPAVTQRKVKIGVPNDIRYR